MAYHTSPDSTQSPGQRVPIHYSQNPTCQTVPFPRTGEYLPEPSGSNHSPAKHSTTLDTQCDQNHYSAKLDLSFIEFGLL